MSGILGVVCPQGAAPASALLPPPRAPAEHSIPDQRWDDSGLLQPEPSAAPS
jgi:hypothetical protein